MNRKYKQRILILLTIFSFSFLFSYHVVKADSGFDNSYDSGGSSWESGGSSWDSGDSNWSSGGSWSSSNSRGSSGGAVGFGIVVTVIVLVVVVAALQKKVPTTRPNDHNGPVRYREDSREYEKQADIALIDPDFKETEFEEFAFDTYKAIQEAWMNFDLDQIRLLVTDEMFHMYDMQLATLEASNQQNKMLNIEKVNALVISLKKEGNVETARVLLEVKCLDYIINQKTNAVVRGDASRRLRVKYILTFTRTIGTIANHEHYQEISCPNCGAMTKVNASGECQYCKGALVSKNHEWVLSKKENVAQWKE